MRDDTPRRGYPKGERRRREIVQTALNVFSERGYGKASMREIALRSGLTQSGLLHHFTTKEELLIEVIALRDERIDEAIAASEAVTFRDQILVIAEHNARERLLSTVYSVLVAESIVSGAPAHEYFVNRYREMRLRTITALREEQAHGRVRGDLDVEAAATSLAAIMDGSLLQQQLVEGVEPVEALGTLYDAMIARRPDHPSERPLPSQ